MNFAQSLVNSIKENAELTILILCLFCAGVVWGEQTFVTQSDLRRALHPIEKSIYDLKTANLQQQRRELRAQIAEIEYAIKRGEASDWQREFLPELQSDLDDIQDQLKRMHRD